MTNHEQIYIITDGCMWEQNKKNSTFHPHAIEAVNINTGQVQYIKSGSKITFVEGEISDLRTQEEYNKRFPEVSSDAKTKPRGTKSKRNGSKKVK